MSSCEKCWRDSREAENYQEVLGSRAEHPCTAEEQAGIDAAPCLICGRRTLHQYTGEAMCRCNQQRVQALPDGPKEARDE